MALPQHELTYTVEAYLEFERASLERHEYLDGFLYKMSGESLEHGDICTNLTGILHSQLRGRPCRALAKDTKIRSGALPSPRRVMKGLFSYPDLVVVCGTPQFHDAYQDVLLNPTVIIEVLSPSTEKFDRGPKFLRYRNFLSSLVDYVLVTQDMAVIDHFHRQDGQIWTMRTIQGLENSLYLASIDCTLQLSEVYERVAFPPAEDELESELEQ